VGKPDEADAVGGGEASAERAPKNGMRTGREQDFVMDESLTHYVTLLGADAQLALDVQAALQACDGPSCFVVAWAPDLQGFVPGECELLMVDVDGRVKGQVELLTQCRRLFPQVPVLALVAHGDTATAVAAMKAGAADCLEKSVLPDRLWSAVTAVLGNEPVSGPRARATLTGTEIRVLRLLLSGKTNLEIAGQFHRSRRTIEAHRRNIMRKLGAAHVSDLVKQAFRMRYIGNGPVDPSPAARNVVCQDTPPPEAT
jgi:two-component system response regulator FixJ